jgi:hypothetical protein
MGGGKFFGVVKPGAFASGFDVEHGGGARPHLAAPDALTAAGLAFTPNGKHSTPDFETLTLMLLTATGVVFAGFSSSDDDDLESIL